ILHKSTSFGHLAESSAAVRVPDQCPSSARLTPIAGSSRWARVKDPAIQKYSSGGLVGRFRSRRWILCGLLVTATYGTRAAADAAAIIASDGELGAVTVTATRIPEPIDQIPATISVVSGEELRVRGARNMASALSLVSGVGAPAGGDAGPSSAVPAFWGLHEFDAFLLVMDEVAWGGAFNPAIASLNLNDV